MRDWKNRVRQMPSRRRMAKRGVSPIIATILLVAITVVLAAVLYVLVSGLTRTGASTPYSLQMSELGYPCGATTCTAVLSLIPTSGLTTGAMGLKIVNTNTQATQPTVAAVAGCVNAAAATACTVTAGGWYAVLVSSGGTVAATYAGASASWGAYAAGTTTIALTGAYQLYIVSAAGNSYAGVATLSSFGVGSSSVSGQVNL